MRNLFIALVLVLSGLALAQDQGMAGMDMSGQSAEKHDPVMRDMQDDVQAMHSMEDHHMDMGPHMEVTRCGRPNPATGKGRSDGTSGTDGGGKVSRHRVALADEYKIFHPEVPQKMYHFTNYWNAFRARKRV